MTLVIGGHKMNNVKLFLTIAFAFALTFIFYCDKNPAKPVRDNPLDARNPQTSGDPFHLQVTIANGGAYLRWNKVELSSLAGYSIYRNESANNNFSKIKSTGGEQTDYTDTSIQNGHIYWYKVVAYNKNRKESSRSNVAAVRINTDPLIVINGGAQYTATRQVNLTILAATAVQIWVSNNAQFSEGDWESYKTSKSWTLPEGEGAKTVFLKAKYSDGTISNVSSDQITLDTTPPSAAFSVSPHSGIAAETRFSFDASATTDNLASSSELTIRWDWDNDGSYDTGWNAAKTASHTYPVGGGNKTVKLEAKDGAGNSSIATRQIYVNTRPVASFTVTPDSGDINETFTFDASACSDYEDNAADLQVRWDWDGDGRYDTNYSTTKTAAHQYSSYDTKTVILQVKDSSGLTNTTQQQVDIHPKDIIYVASGSFQMGSNSGDSDERPIHTVTLDAFYIDKYEVTNAKYAAYLNAALAAGQIQATSSTVTKDGHELLDLDDSYCQISYRSGAFTIDSGKENYPVIEVTWYGAKAYAEFYGERLPTEAEWEYAARGGNLSQGYTYSGSNNVGDVAWYSSNAGGSTHTVGTKQANELGIYDMSGNVWEWCNDWYDSGYYSSSPTNNPQGPSSGTTRVLRGGSWLYNTGNCRVAVRSRNDPNDSNYTIGFRVVQDSP